MAAKKLQRIKPKKITGSLEVREQVPDWLKRLLAEHGERSGPIIGLEGDEAILEEVLPPVEPMPMPEGETAELSALLEKMAEEGSTDFSADQMTTSVEWGAYGDASGEPTSPAIDDLLTDMSVPQDEYHDQAVEYTRPHTAEPDLLEEPDSSMDWLSAPPPTVAEPGTASGLDQPAQQEPMSQFDEGPDWLDESPPSTEAAQTPDWSPEPAASAAPTPATTEADADMPDWLAEALEKPAPMDKEEVASAPTAPASSPPAGARDDLDMPDWLSDALEKSAPPTTSPPAPAAPTPPAAPTTAAESDVDVPDWLLETLDTATGLGTESLTSPPTEPVQPASLSQTDQQESEIPSAAVAETLPETPDSTDTPDWLSDVPAHVEDTSADVDEAQSEADEPDWLLDITSSIEDELPPDWLRTEGSEEEESEEAPVTDVPDVPDWIAEGEAVPSPAEEADQPDISDWLTSTEESPPASADEPASLDWLAETEVSETAGVEEEVPDWLVSTEEETDEALDSVGQEPPDWLLETISDPSLSSDHDLPSSVEATDITAEAVPPPTSDWPADLETPPTETTEPGLKPASIIATDEVPTRPIVDEEDTPLVAAPGEEQGTELEPPMAGSPLRRLTPLKRPRSETISPASPEWVSGLIPPDASGPETEETAPSSPGWVQELVPATTASSPKPDVTSLPDWAAALVPPGFEIETEELPPTESLGQLKRLTSRPEATAFEESELAVSPPLETEDTAGLPDEELETPDWLAEASQATTTAAASTQQLDEVETETPDWLAELRQPTLIDETAPPAESVADEELELPDWLSESSEAMAFEEEPVQPVVEEKLETPDWLSELPPVPDTGELTVPAEPVVEEEVPSLAEPAAEEELGLPSWLSEGRPDLTISEEALAPPAEEEDETPEWLTELPTVPDTSELTLPVEPVVEEVPSPTQLVAEDELEMPSWLSEAEPGLAATEEEDETPHWLSELPAAPDTGELNVPAKPVVEEAPLPAEPVAEEELELPSWLSEADLTATEEASVSPTAEEELETPDWLTELPTARDTGELVVPAKPVVEEAPSPPKPAAEDEIELPSWLFEAEPELAAVEEEDETPDWLSELPVAPDTGELTAPAESVAAEAPAPPAAEEEDETPAWLSELPAAPDTGKLTAPARPVAGEAPLPTETVAEDELEMPSWLSEAEPELAVVAEEDETPAWLSELPAAPDTGQLTAPAEVATEEASTPLAAGEELETRVQSFEKPEVPDTDELLTVEESPPIGPEGDLPDWLSGSTESATVEAASDETDTGQEAELDQLSGVPRARQDTSALLEFPPDDWSTRRAEAIFADEALTEPVAEDEIEPPAWLTELSKPATAGEEDRAPDQAIPTAIEETSAELTLAEELEIPDWLSDLPEATTTEETPTQPARAEEVDTPELRAEPGGPPIVGEAPAQLDTEEEIESTELIVEEESVVPEWLSGILEPTTEQTLTPTLVEKEAETSAQQDEPTVKTEGADAELSTTSEKPGRPVDWLAGLGEATKAVKAALPPEEAETIDTFFLEGEPEAPDWLSDSPEVLIEEEEPDTSPPASSDTDPADIAVEVPDWLKEAPKSEEEPTTSPPDSEKEEPDPSSLETPDEPKASAHTSQSSGPGSWLEAIKPSGAGEDENDSNVAESTGMLAGIPGLLPAEKMTGTTPVTELGPAPTEGRQDALRQAARDFHEVATQVPKPAALPSTLTSGARSTGGILRSGLYLLFIAFIALPLIMRREAPWTEPAGGTSETLDKQRRELISNELGVVDSQQPGSVALVSFDYTTATQGEMEPLAQAVVGRLRGQGMRLIFLSLEPEGAALAQATLERLLEEREESYGLDTVNLGYLPGQVAAIRALVSGQKPLSNLSDYRDGLTLDDPERSGWNDIDNLGQVDMVVTVADKPTTARWWIEQMELAAPPDDGERLLLAATSATANPFLRPYRDSRQLDGLISGLNGAAAIEAGRKNFGLARQMLDSQSLAQLSIVILIAAGTIAGWMPATNNTSATSQEEAAVHNETAESD